MSWHVPITGGVFIAAFLGGMLLIGELLSRAGTRCRLFRSMSATERWFLRSALGAGPMIWWAVILAEAGSFSRLALVAPGVVAAAIWGLRSVRSVRVGHREYDPGWIVVAALLAMGAVAYFPPFDVRLEARDPGVYFLAGEKLARDGALTWQDPLILEMSVEEREYWFPRYIGDRSLRYIGFYLPDVDSGWILPQALPVHPAMIAVGFLVAGESGARAATPLIAILGAITVFMLGRRWVGLAAGAAGALILAASFVQAWFARYVGAELSAQVLVMTGLYGMLMFRRHRDAAFGWLGAMGLGLSLLTKAELLAVGPVLALVLAHDVYRYGLRRREVLHFWLPLGILALHAALHGAFWVGPYYQDLLRQANLSPAAALRLAAIGTAAAVLLLAVLAVLGRSRRAQAGNGGSSSAAGSAGRVFLAGLFVMLAGWAFWIRPAEFYSMPDQAYGWDAMNLVELGWAVSPAFLGLAVLGYFLLLRRKHPRRDAVLLVFVALTVLGIWHRQIIPELPWAYRRWLPVVLPGACLAGGHALMWLVARARRLMKTESSRGRLAAGAASGLLVAALVAGVAGYQASWTTVYGSHQELPGTERVLAGIESILEPGALLIFEPRTRRGLDRLIAALAIDGGYDVLQLRTPNLDESALRSAVLRRARKSEPTYLITTGYLDAPWPVNGRNVGAIDFQTRRLLPLASWQVARAQMRLEPPIVVEDLSIEALVYRLAVGLELEPLFAELDVGSSDDPPYLQGSRYHDAEADSHRDFRWTTGWASMLLPGMGRFARELIVKADPGTYPDLGVREMHVTLDGVQLGTVELRHGWREYRFALPGSWEPPADGVPRLTIEVPSFRPLDDLPGLQDPRTLGVKIDKVGWQPVRPGEGQ